MIVTPSQYWFAAGAIALLFISLGLYHYRPYYEAASIGHGVRDFQELQTRFEELAKKKGGVYAYEVMRRAGLPPDVDLHLLGHAVGDVMYTQTGIDGIAYCTQDFRNACSHTMVIGALTEYGEGALEKIRTACKAAPGGPGAYTMCYHGLGHGVFSYYGYELEPTVTLCEKTGTEEYGDREATECIGGAVMELAGGGGHDPALWEEARGKYITSPLMPCMSDEIPEAAKTQCLIYITPEIWTSVGIKLGNPNPLLFNAAFSICDTIPRTKQSLRDACYAGFGKEFLPLAALRDIQHIDQMPDEVYKKAQSWCYEAEALDGRVQCITEELNSLFWGGENDPRASFRFCSLLQDDNLLFDACQKRLAENIQHYVVTKEARMSLCADISSEFQPLCTVE